MRWQIIGFKGMINDVVDMSYLNLTTYDLMLINLVRQNGPTNEDDSSRQRSNDDDSTSEAICTGSAVSLVAGAVRSSTDLYSVAVCTLTPLGWCAV